MFDNSPLTYFRKIGWKSNGLDKKLKLSHKICSKLKMYRDSDAFPFEFGPVGGSFASMEQ